MQVSVLSGPLPHTAVSDKPCTRPSMVHTSPKVQQGPHPTVRSLWQELVGDCKVVWELVKDCEVVWELRDGGVVCELPSERWRGGVWQDR
jgi:hypothetical protein